MAAAVDEQHTYFLPPARYAEYRAWASGSASYAGIGVRLRGPGLHIADVLARSPAEEAGVHPGDKIVQLEDVPAADLPVDQAASRLRGAEGTPLKLQVVQPETVVPRTLELRRARVQVEYVSARWLADGIGYTGLGSFPEPSVADAVEQAVARFEESGMRALVLDLRGNSGGRLDVGARLLSHFLPAGAVLYEVRERGGPTARQLATQTERYAFPLVVLVDDGTQSMGEIFAAAVQEHGRAIIVGAATTAGNVAGGQVFPLGDGSGMQVTVREIRSATGRPLNRVGVTPDVLVEPGTSGQDLALGEALKLLGANR